MLTRHPTGAIPVVQSADRTSKACDRNISSRKRLSQLYEFYGAGGVLYAILVRVPLIGSLIRWWSSDHRWLGGIIERRGDIVIVDGSTFSVDAPAISRELKSRFLLNRYERQERTAIERFVDPGLPVIELGGSLGVLACLTNKKLLDPCQHVVVEANPNLIDVLNRNKRKNGCKFKVLHRALAYNGDETKFYLNDSFVSGSVQDPTEQPVFVRTINFSELIESSRFDRCTLISDIEGAEVDLVRQEGPALARNVATMILEIHPFITGFDPARSMLQQLSELGFRERFRAGNVRVYRNIPLEGRTQ